MRSPGGSWLSLAEFIAGAELEKQVSTVEEGELQKRFDAEFYQPHLLFYEKSLEEAGMPLTTIGALVKDGYRVVYENTKVLEEDFNPDKHVKFLQAADISDGFPYISEDSMGWVKRKDWERYQHGHIRPGEILVEVKGLAEKVVLVPENFPPRTLVTGTLYKMLIDEAKANRYYVFVYLSSKLGREFRDRGKTNTLISYVSKGDLYNIPIPLPSQEFQKGIEALYHAAQDKHDESQRLYQEAETMLLEALELDTLDLSPQLTYTATSEDAFASNRFDAEFFAPKFHDLKAKLEKVNQKVGWQVSRLGNLSSKLRYGTSEKLEYLQKGVPFLRIADVVNFRFTPETLKYISSKSANQEKMASAFAGDVLISRSGTLGLAVEIADDLNGAIFGSYFIRARPNMKSLHPTYLSTFINSMTGSLQVEKFNTGGIQTNLTIEAIESILIAIPPADFQKSVVNKVHQARAAENEAKGLLEKAKARVEKLILDSSQS